MGDRANKKRIFYLAAVLVLAAVLMCSCVRFESSIDMDITLPEPTESATAEPEATPEATQTPLATIEPTPEALQQIEVYDELGAFIADSKHYRRYISFENIQVYEQAEDTFVDMQAVNEYPKPIVCALYMRFTDENGEVIAECRLQMQDGQYLITLEPGTNTLYAQVPTDMRITSADFTIEYDETIDVLPDTAQ